MSTQISSQLEWRRGKSLHSSGLIKVLEDGLQLLQDKNERGANHLENSSTSKQESQSKAGRFTERGEDFTVSTLRDILCKCKCGLEIIYHDHFIEDLNLRGATPVDFESTALTTRPN
uniref:Uncharacterized protein n=1 Tax=Physcomitrium patens TaxID=3218 RepID=A0A7I4B242_PHYPA